MTDTKRAVIWKAVSSEAQAEDDRQSLPYQETLARDWCLKNGYEVATLLELPGHSRSESDVITALEELAAEGCFAYHDLRRMWQQKNFDILIVHTIDRLARSRSLFMWVVENVIKSGADIYFLTPGVLFNKGNVDYTAPMALMGLRSSLDAFFEKSAATKAAKLAKGIPTSGKKPFGYITLYDDRHRPCGVEVNRDPKLRALLDDAAALILAGVSLRQIEVELFNRFGHNRNGQPYPQNFFRNIFDNPWTWGHAAQGHSNNMKAGGQKTHPWLFDDTIPVPDTVRVHFNTHEALYSGDMVDRLKAEFRRRRLVVSGRGVAQSKPFTGLVLCGHCGRNMTHNDSPHGHSLRCSTNTRRSGADKCPVSPPHTISPRAIQDYLQGLLNDMLANNSPELDQAKQPDYSAQLTRVRTEINSLRGEVMNLITRSATSSASIGDLFQAQIDERTTRIDALETQRVRLEAQAATRHPQAQQQAFDFLKQRAADFWTQPPATINQTLHALLGNLRIVVKDKKVFGRTIV